MEILTKEKHFNFSILKVPKIGEEKNILTKVKISFTRPKKLHGNAPLKYSAKLIPNSKGTKYQFSQNIPQQIAIFDDLNKFNTLTVTSQF